MTIEPTALEERIRLYVDEHMEKVFYFCLKKTGDSHEAEDLASDVTLNVLSSLNRGTAPAEFSAWVWRIARNRYAAWAERKHKSRLSDSGADVSDLELADDSMTLAEEWIHREDLALMRRELAFISSDYRNVIVSFYLEDKGVREIAKSLRLPEGTVKARLFRARKRLKEGMNMARDFGSRSYRPENVNFTASGSQPSGLPWSAVQRKIPKNILLEASNNPSTAEELSVALGIALPYMEEEIKILKNATLLRETDGKYVTDFFIADKETQLTIYNTLRKTSEERSALLDRIIEDSLPAFRALKVDRVGMTDNDLKWFLVPYWIDRCLSDLPNCSSKWHEKRANGEDWGFIGFESVELPTPCMVNHCGTGGNSPVYWMYGFSDYDMWRYKIMSVQEVKLLHELVESDRTIDTLTDSEKDIWSGINGKYAHADESDRVIPDILYFEKGALDATNKLLHEHPLYPSLLKLFQDAFDETVAILTANTNPILHKQLPYCASSFIYWTRMMSVHDEVNANHLIPPANPKTSNVAMWLAV